MTGLVFVLFLVWLVVTLVRRSEVTALRADVIALKLRVATLEGTTGGAAADDGSRRSGAASAGRARSAVPSSVATRSFSAITSVSYTHLRAHET